jgi:hypothetical protein
MRRQVLLICALALGACSNHSTAEEAGRKFGRAFCVKLQQCFPSQFAQSYSSVDACVEKGIQAIPASQRSAEEACSDSEVDTCVQDTQSMGCASSPSGMKLPASCSGC